MARWLNLGLILCALVTGCSHGRNCAAYTKQETALTYARDSQITGSPEYNRAALVLAHFVVGDRTGCASPTDKAQAQADLDQNH